MNSFIIPKHSKLTAAFALLFFALNAHAQSNLTDALITNTTQGTYTDLSAIRKAKITSIRETYYKADTTTHQVDMNKPDRITLYSYAYLGERALIIQQVAALAKDTNTLIENYQWGYDQAGRLIAYQGASTDIFEYAKSMQIQRDAEGLIKMIAEAVTYKLSEPAKPLTYTYQCNSNGKNITSVRKTYTENEKTKEKRLFFEYDANSNLILCELSNEKEREKSNAYSYDKNNQLVKETETWYSSYEKYIPATAGVAMFGVVGSPATTRKISTSQLYEYTYEYDTQDRLVKSIYTTGSTSSDPEDEGRSSIRITYEYNYSAAGVPETIKSFNDKGLIGLKKLEFAK
jgi:hypothetical protein